MRSASAAALDQMIEDDAARETALGAMAGEIRRRAAERDAPLVEIDAAFAAAEDALRRS